MLKSEPEINPCFVRKRKREKIEKNHKILLDNRNLVCYHSKVRDGEQLYLVN